MKVISIPALALMAATLGSIDGATAQQAKLFFEGDMVRHGVPGQPGPTCVLSNQFKRKEAVAFRIRVLQPSGAVADNSVLKGVVVELGNGQKLPAHFGPHGNPATDYFWSLHWDIPADHPTGTIGYKVVATLNDGSVVEWKPFNRAQTALMIVPGEPVAR